MCFADLAAVREPSSVLQEARMNLIADDTCALDEHIAAFGLRSDVMLCAGYPHGHITICNVS